MGIDFILLTAVQLLLTAGVGGVIIVVYATRGIFLREEEDSQPSSHSFPSEYEELMWLAERQKQRLDSEETLRFYQLRRNWAEMHSRSSV